MFRKILVCLDGSSLSEQILPYATEAALRFGGKVVLLQVITISSTIAAAAEPGLPPEVLLDELRREGAKAKAYLERTAQPLQEKGLDVTCVVLQGMPGNAIVSYSTQNEVDLVAIATHGHGGLGRLVFGSVADLVLRESGLPILVIKPQDTKK